MASWTIICNIDYFDIFGAFNKLEKIEWKQTAKSVEKGDILYIYIGKPIQEIRFKCIVNKTEIPYTETVIDESEFTSESPNYIHDGIYMEIELVQKFEAGVFPYSALKENGLKSIQGPSRVAPELQAYLDKKEQENAYKYKRVVSTESIAMSKQLVEKYKLLYRLSNETSQNVYGKNIILYGPPGTGKTYYTAIYAVAICDGKSIDELIHADYSEVMERYNELKSQNRIAFTTFHQSYGYEEFIEGLRPYIVPSSGEKDIGSVGYRVESGIFKKFCETINQKNIKYALIAQKHSLVQVTDTKEITQNYVFIIDEINRGNISKIFGELITLIEPTKRKGAVEAMEAILPYSGKAFSVPANVFILGTMNTADRSIALMDTALRRRFQFIEMMPDTSVLQKAVVEADGETLNVSNMLDVINERIAFLYDREHTIGHAFFMGLVTDPSVEKLASVFETSVIPLLQEYFYEDYYKIQLVLGDNEKSEQDEDLKFIKDTKIVAENIFAGNIEDIDLPEKKYEINPKAFYNIQSYKKIAKEL